MAKLILGLGFLLTMMFFVNSGVSATGAGFRLHLTRADSRGGYTRAERIQRGVRRSRSRASAALGGRYDIADNEFVVDFAVGTPGVLSTAVVDTGTDLVWAQCSPCVQCFPQPQPIYDPSDSESFSPLHCDSPVCEFFSKQQQQQQCGNYNNSCSYLYGYADGRFTTGFMGRETLSLSGVPFKGIAFGCGNNNTVSFTNASGIVGLSRAPPSLISQLGIRSFSHCFASYDDPDPTLLALGGSSVVSAAQASTPLLTNSARPSLYYVNLLGLSLGGTRLDIPTETFRLNGGDSGGGGTLVDIGVAFTFLDSRAFGVLAESFASQLNLNQTQEPKVGFDRCFDLRGGVSAPILTFHFEGMDVELPADNYVFVEEEQGVMCLAIFQINGVSIVGNFQMQKMLVTYDLATQTISIVPAVCPEL